MIIQLEFSVFCKNAGATIESGVELLWRIQITMLRVVGL
jgi:hypothetical protein